MPKGTTFENDILKAIFTAINIALLLDNTATTPIVNLYVALHTGTPGAGNQSNNEAAYTGYARSVVSRNAAGWTVSANNVVNAGATAFNVCSGASNALCSHVSIGMNANADSKILFHGALNDTLNVSNGVTPSFAAGNLKVTET
jgi:hypothetical protein